MLIAGTLIPCVHAWPAFSWELCRALDGTVTSFVSQTPLLARSLRPPLDTGQLRLCGGWPVNICGRTGEIPGHQSRSPISAAVFCGTQVVAILQTGVFWRVELLAGLGRENFGSRTIPLTPSPPPPPPPRAHHLPLFQRWPCACALDGTLRSTRNHPSSLHCFFFFKTFFKKRKKGKIYIIYPKLRGFCFVFPGGGGGGNKTSVKSISRCMFLFFFP